MRLTTTQRMVALVTGAVMAVQVASFVLQYRIVRHDLNARLENLVLTDMAGFAALYEQRRIIAVREAIEYRVLTGGDDGLLMSLRDRDGAQIAGNLAQWPREAVRPPEGQTGAPFRFRLDGQEHVGLVRNLRGRFPLFVARGTAGLEATLTELRWLAGKALAAALAVSLAVGWLASWAVMRRLKRINALADRVAAGDVSARLPEPRVEDEYAQLERHIHAMLDRIEGLNRATHHLSDTIAHELRTPLTRIQNRLAAIVAGGAEVEAAKAQLRETVRIFDSLLEIARAEAGGNRELDLAPLDLSAVTRELAELYEPLAEEGDIRFATEIAMGIEVLGDRNLVAQLISNLLDNALKFCPEGAMLRLALTEGGDRHCLEIADTGPGLPPGFAEELFQRFSRGHPDRAGHGLGMALVRAIALRHGAKVVVPPADQGFAIRILWPKVRSEL